MELDLKAIFNGEVKSIDLNYTFNMLDENFDGVYPLKQPVEVKGVIKNSADVVKLVCDIKATVTKPCDRCCEEVSKPYNIKINSVLVLSNDNENEDYIPVPSYKLDLYELVRSEIVLNLPLLHLCSEDCLGVCFICGQNLNKDKCNCIK